MAGAFDQDQQEGEVGVAEYAEHRGISTRAVQAKVQAGQLSGAVRQTPSGRYWINQAVADKVWIARGDAKHIGKMKSASGLPEDEDLKKVLAEVSDFNAAKAKEKKYQAELAKMEYEEKIQKLVEKKQVQEKLFEMARKIRNNLLNIPAKIMDVLAAEMDPYAVEKILNDEIKKTLEDLTDEFT